ncbi:MAG: CPBP family intramembrane metalloprotease [Chloroflexi bacterium]|nr:CPBP family intramembrane metalloprotease [Chloroflexota bacterium]
MRISLDHGTIEDFPSRLLTWPLVAYFLLRIVAASLVGVLVPPQWRAAATEMVEVSMYMAIIAMIYIARDDLIRHHMDRPSLVIFLVFGTLLRTSTSLTLSYEEIAGYALMYLASIALIVALLRDRIRWQSDGLRILYWSLVGVISGLVLLVVVLVPGVLESSHREGFHLPYIPALSLIPAWFVGEMGHSAILEEPVFRGFFWGYLRGRGWGERRIWLVQGIVFWLAHLRYLSRPYTFFLTVPVAGLVLGWLAWRSRSVAPASFAHAVYNSIPFLISNLSIALD